MGWFKYIKRQTKKQFVTELINRIKSKEHHSPLLTLRLDSHSLRGQELWLCYIDQEDKTSYIVLYKLTCQHGEWFYTDISETEDLCSHSLPPKYMLKYPCCVKDNKYSIQFREWINL